jgi:BirA family transcriptional regulator, biotin operon repressor / biotin---[acetyl-CoA-carboxylase] ligase
VTDDFTAERIAAARRGRWADPLRVLKVTPSTNDEALDWARSGAPEGATVVADHQTAGRGRRGRTWWSQPGGSLMFSLILRPERPAAELGLLSTAVGVACADAVEDETGLALGLKWPNDLVAGGRKVGGILVESISSGAEVEVAVVGVGLNVAEMSWAPDEVRARSTTLAAELGAAGLQPAPERAIMLAAIVVAFERLYPALTPGSILPGATARSDILGRRVRLLRADGTSFEGKAVALLPTGELELATHDGTRLAVNSGEVATLHYPDRL